MDVIDTHTHTHREERLKQFLIEVCAALYRAGVMFRGSERNGRMVETQNLLDADLKT